MKTSLLASLSLGMLVACRATEPEPSSDRPELASTETLGVTLAAGGVT